MKENLQVICRKYKSSQGTFDLSRNSHGTFELKSGYIFNSPTEHKFIIHHLFCSFTIIFELLEKYEGMSCYFHAFAENCKMEAIRKMLEKHYNDHSKIDINKINDCIGTLLPALDKKLEYIIYAYYRKLPYGSLLDEESQDYLEMKSYAENLLK